MNGNREGGERNTRFSDGIVNLLGLFWKDEAENCVLATKKT